MLFVFAKNWPQRKTLSNETLLRLFPILLLGFFDFAILNDGLSRTLHNIRGHLRTPENLLIIEYEKVIDIVQYFDQKKIDSENTKCLVAHTEKFPVQVSTCTSLNIVQLYSKENWQNAFLAIQKEIHPAQDFQSNINNRAMFFAPLKNFSKTNMELLKSDPHKSELPSLKSWIFVPKNHPPQVKIETPLGLLEVQEIVVNLAASAHTGIQLKKIPYVVQVLVTALTALGAIAIIYSYPVLLSAIFFLAFGGGLFALSVLFLDRMHYNFPLSQSLLTLFATYLVGLSDRLDRRERREWALERESEALHQIDEMRSNFLSLVSHDLKTPIAKLQSQIEQILRGDFGALNLEQKNELHKALSANGSLRRSISTILLLSRVESRDIVIHFQPSDLLALLSEVIEAHTAFAQEKSVTLKCEFESLFLVDIDPALVKEVAHNLLDNALKYTPQNGIIVIRCGESELCAELSPPRTCVWFEVQDNGPGIPKIERSKVFAKFEKGSAPAPDSFESSMEGTGLGLFLSRYFVEQHSGSIKIISKIVEETLLDNDQKIYFKDNSRESGTVMRVSLPSEQNTIKS